MNDSNLERLEHLVLLNSRPPIDIDLVDQLAHEYERKSLLSKALSLYFGINDIDRVYSLFTKIALNNTNPASSKILWYTSHFHSSMIHPSTSHPSTSHPSTIHSSTSNPSSQKPTPLSDTSYALPFFPIHHLRKPIKSASLDGFHISFSSLNLPLLISDILFHILKYHFPIQEYLPSPIPQIPPNTLFSLPSDIPSYSSPIYSLLSNYNHLLKTITKIRDFCLKSTSTFRSNLHHDLASLDNLIHQALPSYDRSFHPPDQLQKLISISTLLLTSSSYLSQVARHQRSTDFLFINILPPLSEFISNYDISSLLLHHYFKSSPFFIL